MPNIVNKGGRVALLDAEDFAWKTYQRAEAMDVVPYFESKDQVRHIGDDVWESASDFARDQLYLWLLGAVDPVYSCVIIDSAERTGAPSDGGSIADWLAKVVKPFHSRKIGVIVIDHSPKHQPQDDTARGPIGSQGKRAAYTGVGIRATGIPWTRTKNGSITLTCDKDRNGVWQEDETMAVMHGNWMLEDGRKVLKLTFDVPANEGKEGGSEPEAIETHLLQTIADTGDKGVLGTVQLWKISGVTSKAGFAALRTIKATGWVNATVIGPKKMHHLHATELGKAHLMGRATTEEISQADDNHEVF